jgi:protein SCO1/2
VILAHRSGSRRATRVARLVRIACLCLLTGCGRSAGHAPPSARVPSTAARVGAIALPEVRENGVVAPFRFQAPPGHLLVVYFGYTTCPDVCPTTLSDLHHALALLGSDAARVELAFVTVDPARDTAEVLAPYVRAFVTGGHALRPDSDAQLASAERAFGASSSVTKDAEGVIEVSHSATGYLVDEQGRIVGQWPFGIAPERMASGLRTLLPGTQR